MIVFRTRTRCWLKFIRGCVGLGGRRKGVQAGPVTQPSHEYARERYAMFLAARGQTEAALAQIAEARRVDPLSALIASSAGGILRYARRYDDAITQYNQVLARHPDFLSANVGLARTLNAAGRHDEAIARYRTLTARGVNEPFFLLEIAQADAAAGRTDAAKKTVDTLQQRSQAGGMFVPPESYAYVYARLGDFDRAFSGLTRHFEPVPVLSCGFRWILASIHSVAICVSLATSSSSDSHHDAISAILHLTQRASVHTLARSRWPEWLTCRTIFTLSH